MSHAIKVVFLSGWGRSGSTLLGNLLGQVDGFHHVGELRAWDGAYLDGRACGCGEILAECEFWNRCLAAALGGLDAAAAEAFRATRWNHTRYRHIPCMLLPGGGARIRRRLSGYLDTLGRIYAEIAVAGGRGVIVDSSKFATYGWLLAQIASLDVRVVQLVRDPRAVAWSWGRTRAHGDSGREIRRHGPVTSAIGWSFWNSVSELLFRRRALRVRYEDVVREPAPTLRSILDFAGESQRSVDFIAGGRAELGTVNHTVLGNPGRVTRGTIELREDTEWAQRMGSLPRLAVAGLCAPHLARYGYAWSGAATS